MNSLSFFVQGEPKGQPRARAFARKFGNKFMARMYDPGTAEAWKSCIAAGIKGKIPSQPFIGPIALDIRFFFPRPKSHFRKAGLKPTAPSHHSQKPDCDNAAKAVMDALTILGLWSDDKQVCRLSVSKNYAQQPGAEISVREICE
jgi:Holliday junction resolvase RusA-like endonuclease